MRCGRNAGVPYIVAPQGSYDPWVLGQRSLVNRLWDRRMELSLLNHAARIQCLSVREVEQVKAVGIVAPVTILPNGVGDATRASEREKEDARNTLGITRDASVILFLGRLHPKKGLDVLIRAFAQLQVPAMHPLLLIAGSDAGSGYAQAMKMLASETGIGDRIRFLGEVKGYEKSLALAAADVFALPSHSEGLPVALLEAMSAGLPVVITDACNLPEVEKSGAGIVIADGGDALQPLLAEAMRRLAGDAKLRQTMGMRAKALVANRFSWKRLADDLTDLYEAVLRTSR